MDKMREEFESAWRSARLGERYSNEHTQVEISSFYPDRNKYGYSDIQEAWFFWQASRKALVVELPYAAFFNDANDSPVLCYRAAEIEKRLDAAGVKY